MAVDVSSMQSLIDEASDAIGAGNWDTAETKLLQAKAKLAGLPDSSDQAGTSMSWRQTITSLLKDVRRKRGNAKATTGLTGTPIEYERPDAD